MSTPLPTVDRPTGSGAPPSSRRLRGWLGLASLAALVAGGLHIAAAAQHVEHGDVVVSFFLLVAAAQVGGGLGLGAHAVTGMRPGPWLVLAGLVATVGLIALFVVAYGTDLLSAYVSQPPGSGAHASHTGPFADGIATRNDTLAGIRQPPGALGMAVLAAELAGVATLTALLPHAWRRRVLDGLLVLCGIAWALWFTGVLA